MLMSRSQKRVKEVKNQNNNTMLKIVKFVFVMLLGVLVYILIINDLPYVAAVIAAFIFVRYLSKLI